MSEPRVLGIAMLPLSRAALCLDCETCYQIGEPACPACASRAWTLLSRFLMGGPPQPRTPNPDPRC